MIKLPLSLVNANAGISPFESTAADFEQDFLSIDDVLISHPHATYIGIVSEVPDMKIRERGLNQGDLLVIDSSIHIKSGDMFLSRDGSIQLYNDKCTIERESIGIITSAIKFYGGKFDLSPLLDCPLYSNLSCKLNELLIGSPSSTFLARVQGESMIDAGIFPADLIAVNRAAPFLDNTVIVANFNGQFVLKIADKINRRLLSANPSERPWQVTQSDTFSYEGSVLFSIHKYR